MECKYTEGGVCAAKGFRANGIHCGIRKNKSKRDLALIVSEKEAAAAAVYTTNLVKGAPIAVTRKNLENGRASVILCNSGNANTCNADGYEKATEMCAIAAKQCGIEKRNVVVASTGVIGMPLDTAPIRNSIAELYDGLTAAPEGSRFAAEAIMTTDTIVKEVAVRFEIDGVPCSMGGIAKGSGMIHPNMATMLIFITCDALITPELLGKALREDVKTSFNMISIDGDTSTNDMAVILSNGMAGNEEITEENEDYRIFADALFYVNRELAKMIAGDGEGATALFEVKVIGAENKEQAVTLSKSIVTSNLTKAAIYGHDANWGRILCAMGYSGADFDPEKVDLYFESAAGRIKIIENGVDTGYSEEEATKILSEKTVTAIADVKMGDAEATAWGCDLTHEYVSINADYRS